MLWNDRWYIVREVGIYCFIIDCWVIISGCVYNVILLFVDNFFVFCEVSSFNLFCIFYLDSVEVLVDVN